MAKVNISSYSGSVVSGNWKPAMDAAWAAIKANGGTIYLDSQTITMKTGSNLIPDSPNQVPLLILGDGSSRVLVDGQSSTPQIFTSANVMCTTYRDLIIHGNEANTTTADCAAAIAGNYGYLMSIENCSVSGLRADTAVVSVGVSSSLKAVNSQFGGNNTPAVILLDNAERLNIENCEFLDYQTVVGTYHSKTPSGVGAWIKCMNPTAANGATAHPLKIGGCRFDEGAGKGIHILGYPQVEIERSGFNVNGGGVGIQLENVAKAVIKQCNFGYTANDVPAVKLINCGEVAIVDAMRDHGVFRVEVDSASNAGLKMIRSGGLTVDVV